jgi:hypothetical protein
MASLIQPSRPQPALTDLEAAALSTDPNPAVELYPLLKMQYSVLYCTAFCKNLMIFYGSYRYLLTDAHVSETMHPISLEQTAKPSTRVPSPLARISSEKVNHRMVAIINPIYHYYTLSSRLSAIHQKNAQIHCLFDSYCSVARPLHR